MANELVIVASAGKEIFIAQVLTQVQQALQEAANRMTDSFPTLRSVRLTLQTWNRGEIGGVFKFLIFVFGRRWAREHGHEMVLTLEPPAAGLSAFKGPELAKSLTAAIVAAATGVKDALNGQPPLKLSAFTTSITFVVSGETSGGVEFEIVPATLGLSGLLQRRSLHRVDLTFSL